MAVPATLYLTRFGAIFAILVRDRRRLADADYERRSMVETLSMTLRSPHATDLECAGFARVEPSHSWIRPPVGSA
jgi:hypothetical protein